jgi:hypothetical protein
MRAALALSLTASLAVAACGGGGGGATDDSGEVRFVTGVRHSYFPLVEGSRWVLEGEEEGQDRRDEVRVLDGTRVVAGVACTAVLEEFFLDGRLAETTTEWFAEDLEGNVWKFGEESFGQDTDFPVRSDDSWIAGEDGARPFVAFPRRLRVGDVFFGFAPGAPDEFRVLSLTDTLTLPAGRFDGCLRLWENPLDVEDADILLYAPGVGRVSETTPTGFVNLVSVDIP